MKKLLVTIILAAVFAALSGTTWAQGLAGASCFIQMKRLNASLSEGRASPQPKASATAVTGTDAGEDSYSTLVEWLFPGDPAVIWVRPAKEWAPQPKCVLVIDGEVQYVLRPYCGSMKDFTITLVADGRANLKKISVVWPSRSLRYVVEHVDSAWRYPDQPGPCRFELDARAWEAYMREDVSPVIVASGPSR